MLKDNEVLKISINNDGLNVTLIQSRQVGVSQHLPAWKLYTLKESNVSLDMQCQQWGVLVKTLRIVLQNKINESMAYLN